MHYCWTHNTCSSISKTHADALSHYWESRQTEQQGSYLCKNTVQLLLGMCQNIKAMPLFAPGTLVQVSSQAVELHSFVRLDFTQVAA